MKRKPEEEQEGKKKVKSDEEGYCSIPLDSRTSIDALGDAKLDSPLGSETVWVDDKTFVLHKSIVHEGESKKAEQFELAGPRQQILHDPSTTKVAILTAGGLCPGVNDVIRALVFGLWYRYGVRQIVGYKYGYQGLNPTLSESVLLNPSTVKEIHKFGGTILGTSRGPQPIGMMVDFLVTNNINILFLIGGDGTLHGGMEMAEEVKKRDLKISIIGIPKTIDNDICYTQKTFGFDTAVQLAQHPLDAAHCEARSAENGIGIVKLMGRDSGFIALYASLSNADVNLCLLPEVSFSMQQIHDYVLKRLQKSKHCVIAIAEGAGKDLVPSLGVDKSGNKILGDITKFVKDELDKKLKEMKIEHTIKFIDPSYTIRSAPCIPSDAHFCIGLAHAAVHAAMAGKTGMMVSYLNSHFVHVPFHLAIEKRKVVDPSGIDYQTLLANNGQPF